MYADGLRRLIAILVLLAFATPAKVARAQPTVSPDAEVALTTAYAVSPVASTLPELIDLAKRANPNVVARKDREDAAAVNQRIARAAYLPSLSLSAGYGGYKNS